MYFAAVIENFNRFEMYGSNYGYMSSLNQSMVNHLKNKSEKIKKISKLSKNDLIVDIGSNDGTFLSFFQIYVKQSVLIQQLKNLAILQKKLLLFRFLFIKYSKKYSVSKKAKAIFNSYVLRS